MTQSQPSDPVPALTVGVPGTAQGLAVHGEHPTPPDRHHRGGEVLDEGADHGVEPVGVQSGDRDRSPTRIGPGSSRETPRRAITLCMSWTVRATRSSPSATTSADAAASPGSCLVDLMPGLPSRSAAAEAQPARPVWPTGAPARSGQKPSPDERRAKRRWGDRGRFVRLGHDDRSCDQCGTAGSAPWPGCPRSHGALCKRRSPGRPGGAAATVGLVTTGRAMPHAGRPRRDQPGGPGGRGAR